jgi:RNA polymerase sigma-70 factor (ECF subfamily)
MTAANLPSVTEELLAHLSDLRVYARSLTGNRHDADDLVQDTIERVLGAAERFTPGTHFKAWAFTILRNRFLNAYARPSRAQPIDDVDPELFASPAGQEQTIEYQEFRSSFARLSPDYREVLILVAGTSLNYTEIASICGCAEGTIKSRVFRARAELSRLTDRQTKDARVTSAGKGRLATASAN